MASYNVAGTRLSYRRLGTGRPVVFLHATPLDGRYWLPMGEYLHGVDAIVPDLRGHGASELGELPLGELVAGQSVLGVDRLAADVVALLDHLQLESAVVVGCSVGGYTALEMWRQAPERVEALGFVCSKAQPDAEANLERRRATIARVRAVGAAEFFDAQARGLCGRSAQAARPAIVDELRQMMTLTADAVCAMQAGLAVRPDSIETVETIEVPVAAICGGEDAGVTAAEMQAFHAAPGGCSFQLLPSAGHLAAYEQPLAVAALLTGWLESL